MRNFASVRDRVRWFQEPGALRSPVILIINAIQSLPAHFQIMAVAMTFRVMCKGTGLSPQDILNRIDRMESHVDGPFSNQIAAMTEYVKGELND